MDGNNWRATQAEPNMVDAPDWGTQLQADSRQRIVNKIMDTLKRLFHISGPEGLLEIKKIAVRLEEKSYHASSSQADYLRKISLKMLTMETKSITDVADVLLPNSVVGNQNPADQAMDGNNWRATQAEPNMVDAPDWRTQLQPVSRDRIVTKIMNTLKRHNPFSSPEELLDIEKIVVRFEEKVYHAAFSQADYVRRISLKMLTIEANPMANVANVLLPNSVVGNQNPADQGPSKRKSKDSEGPTKTKARKTRSSSVGSNLTNDKNKSKINEGATLKEVNTSQRKSAKKTKEENIKTIQLRSVRFTQ